MNEPYDIIDTACLTEKATILADEANKYVFRVAKHANKIQIKQAVETLFKKKVASVNTCNYLGKTRRERTLHEGRSPNWKKAIVTLAQGDKIELA